MEIKQLAEYQERISETIRLGIESHINTGEMFVHSFPRGEEVDPELVALIDVLGLSKIKKTDIVAHYYENHIEPVSSSGDFTRDLSLADFDSPFEHLNGIGCLIYGQAVEELANHLNYNVGIVIQIDDESVFGLVEKVEEHPVVCGDCSSDSVEIPEGDNCDHEDDKEIVSTFTIFLMNNTDIVQIQEALDEVADRQS